MIVNAGAGSFVSSAKLRSPAELLDAADLIYRYHWAVRQAKLDGMAEPPAALVPPLVEARHVALYWLIGVGDDWDNIDTST